MHRILIAIILGLVASFADGQSLKADAGKDLSLTCFDEVRLNGRLVNWLSSYQSEVGLKSVFFANDSVGYAAGGEWNRSVILKTTDGGKTWSQLSCPVNTFLNDVMFLNRDTGFVVGGRASAEEVILKTVDGGISWSIKTSMNKTELNAVFFLSDFVGYAVGESSTVIKTTDGGETWSRLTVPGCHYQDVVFLNDTLGFAIGTGGMVIKTSDGGETWQIMNLNIAFQLNAIALTGNTAWVAGAEGLILRSDDLFETFSVSQSGVTGDLHAIAILNKDTLTCAGRKNTILLTCDGGRTWRREFSDYQGDLYSSVYVSAGKQMIAGSVPGFLDRGYIASWSPIPPGITVSWTPPDYLSNPNTLTPVVAPQEPTTYVLTIMEQAEVVCRDTMRITLREPGVYAGPDTTVNGKDTIQLHGLVENGIWSQPDHESRCWFYAVHFLNRDTGFIAGGQIAGSLLKTTDGGLTWQHKVRNIDFGLRDVCFINDSVGFSVGYKGLIMKTGNCGENWAPLTSNTGKGLTSICFIDQQTGFVAGEGGTVLKTDNGGASWHKLNTGFTYDLQKIFFVDENRGFATSMSLSGFYQTNDGGDSWEKIEIQGMWMDYTDIFFVDDYLGFMVGGTLSPFGLLKTTDGGITWQSFLFPRLSLVTYTSVFFTDAYTGYVTNEMGEILKTADGGNTWYIMDTITGGLNDTWFIDDGNAFAVGNVGTISSFHANGRLQYNWFPATNMTGKNTMHPLICPDATTTLYFEASVPGGCFIVDETGITVKPSNAVMQDFEPGDEVRIFPNPSHDRFTICFDNKAPEAYALIISDDKGIERFRTKVFSAGPGRYSCNHHLAPGCYILKVTNSRHRQMVNKLVIQ